MLRKLILIVLIVMIVSLASRSLLAGDLPQTQKMEGIINKQLEIERFQVDIELKIAAFSGQKSGFKFTYYYQEPDKIHIATEDFVLLPREALKTLQPNFFHLSRYNYRYLDTSNGFQRFELIPKESQGNYRLIIWFDLEASLIQHAEVFFAIESYQEEFKVQIDYQQLKGYSLPVYVQGKLAVPSKFGMGGEIKEFQHGSFTLAFSNYQINRQFPDRIRKKLKSYQLE